MSISGFRTPLRLSSSRFVTTRENTKLVENAKNILRTSVTERWYEPNNGVQQFQNILFGNFDSGALGDTVANFMAEALNAQETRANWFVTFLGTNDDADGNKANFLVQFLRKDSAETESFTFEVIQDE